MKAPEYDNMHTKTRNMTTRNMMTGITTKMWNTNMKSSIM